MEIALSLQRNGSWTKRPVGLVGGSVVLSKHVREFENAVYPEMPTLYRVARRMGASAELAEDLVQATLLDAYRSWERFDGRFLRSWLIRILRNHYLRDLRSKKPEVNFDDMDIEPVSDNSFWDEVLWKTQATDLMESLERLPDHYRIVVQLCDVEEMSYEEASNALDIPIGTIRSRLFRGRTMLRRTLSGVIAMDGVREKP